MSEEDHLIGGRTGLDLALGAPGRVDGADLVTRTGKQRGICRARMKEGAVIAMARLQYPLLPALDLDVIMLPVLAVLDHKDVFHDQVGGEPCRSVLARRSASRSSAHRGG